jgi:hypothetical protein
MMSNITENSGESRGRVIDFRTGCELELAETNEQSVVSQGDLAESTELSVQDAPSTTMEVRPNLGKIREVHPILDFARGELIMALPSNSINPETGEIEPGALIVTSGGDSFDFHPDSTDQEGLSLQDRSLGTAFKDTF